MQGQLSRIENNIKRNDVKSKKSKNLVKKCNELSIICGLQISLVIYDPKYNQLQEFNSHSDFTTIDISRIILSDRMA